MQGLRDEINQIPEKALECIEKSSGLDLPENVPYIGMGSSYFAPLTVQMAGAKINPFIASEYYYYLSNKKLEKGVLISQSGESSETVWNIEKFQSIVSISNNQDSSLGTAQNLSKFVNIYSGDENYSSTKSYTNTLVALYLGHGFDLRRPIDLLKNDFHSWDEKMKDYAKETQGFINNNKINGMYVIGSGPNMGSAYQVALTLSETTKYSWNAMSVAQYDHGPKETAEGTIVVILNSHGKDKKRIDGIKLKLKKVNCLVVEILETEVDEKLSPITLLPRGNMYMDHLADFLEVGDTFELGGKVTTVDNSEK